MIVYDNHEINSMYVTRDDDGTINLYPAYHDSNDDSITVFSDLKNKDGIGQLLYGSTYTNKYIIERMEDRPTHRFIGYLCGPMSFPYNPEKVKFI